MNRHLSSFTAIGDVADALVDDLIDSESSPIVGSLFPILRIDHIFGSEGSS